MFGPGPAPDSVTTAVIAICVAAFLGLSVLDLLHVVDWDDAVGIFGISYVGVVRRLWLFEFMTAPFVHLDLTHLGFNMLSLWMLGPDVERRLGRARYVLFSALCGIASLAAFLTWSLGTGIVAFGYSGVIFGLLVAQATYFPDRMLMVWGLFPVRMRHAAPMLGAIELYLTLAAERGGNIANVGHLSGALAAWAYLRWAVPRTTRAPIAAVPLAPRRQVPLAVPRPRPRRRHDVPWEL